MTPVGLAGWLGRPPSCVAVIGASGWIGMALVDRLLAARPGLEAPQLRLFGSTHRVIEIRGRTLAVEPLDRAADLDPGDWLVLHAAIVGADRVGDAAGLRQINDGLLDQVLALADKAAARRLVFFSSGAVHRCGFGSPAKQAYARMKADHEAAVADRARAGGWQALIPRVFNLGGPYINHVGAYALGDFIQAAGRGERIAIGAAKPVFRSYVHVGELAAVVLDAAVAATPAPAPFDVAGAEIVELGALARRVLAAMGLPEAMVDRPPAAGGESDWYVGDARAWQEMLFNAGLGPVTLDRIIADTVAYLETGRS